MFFFSLVYMFLCSLGIECLVENFVEFGFDIYVGFFWVCFFVEFCYLRFVYDDIWEVWVLFMIGFYVY